MDPSGVLVHGSVDFYLEVSLKKLEDIFNWQSNFATYKGCTRYLEPTKPPS